MADQKQQAIADARLIAAAPDLLAALKNLLGDIQDEDKDRSPHDWSVQVCVRNALVAIKKATGE
jgi:hypothetical protein